MRLAYGDPEHHCKALTTTNTIVRRMAGIAVAVSALRGMVSPSPNDWITASALLDRVDLGVAKRPRLGGKEPSEVDDRM